MKKLILSAMICLPMLAFGVEVTDLRCEYLKNPQGIDIVKPRLSWRLEVRDQKSELRGQRQTAYQVLVASTTELLKKDRGDLWDSGKVKSDQSVHVVYAGKPLTSRMECYWKVRVWDKNGKASESSQPANWTMGLLKPEEWSGKWISIDRSKSSKDKLSFKGCFWIWGNQGQNKCPLTRIITIPSEIKSARARITADDKFWLMINGQNAVTGPKGKDVWKSPVSVDIARFLKKGENKIVIEGRNWGGGAGALGRFEIIPKDGDPIQIVTDSKWTVGADQPARQIAQYGGQPWGPISEGSKLDSRNSPMLRKAFKLKKAVKSAQVSICGLGYYEMYLNGAKVGDHVLDPTWTTYHKSAHYVTYDISEVLKEGDNALGVQLANGVYNQEFRDAWNYQQAPWKAFPQMLLQLDVVYEDGSKMQVVSDESWKASTGPIYWDQLRMGVMYDAQKEQPGWATAKFDDSKWTAVKVREGIKGKLSAQMAEPIKVMKTLKAKSVSEKEGVYTVDFGQNIAGWTRLKAKGDAGTKITLDHGKHGLVYGKPLQTSVYTLRGKGEEIWEPTFSYYGFSKVKVTGFPGKLEKDAIDARVVYTAFDDRGAFECSNDLLNRVVHLSRWSYMGNFVGIPTDCPHREKNGWSADAHLATELGLCFFGAEAAYARWMLDFEASMAKDGKLPCIIPDGGRNWGMRFLDGPSWESAYLIIPWHIYEYRGDRRILEYHYENYKKWISWYRDPDKVIRKRKLKGTRERGTRYKNPQKVNQDGIITYGIGDWPPNGKTPFEITSTAYYYESARIISKIAGMLGKSDDEKEYAELAEKTQEAFNREFYNEANGTYPNNSQTATSCALFFGLVEEKNRQKVADKLAETVKQKGYMPEVGCLGSKYLLRALADNGHLETAYKVMIRKEKPGWGYLAASGRTTLTEQLTGGGSDNHVFLGDISAFMMQYFAGIQLDKKNPGFQKFFIKPNVVGDLTWVKSHHDSPYGRIESSWKIEDGKFKLNITVPPNSTATVIMPGETTGKKVGSGKYSFEKEWKK